MRVDYERVPFLEGLCVFMCVFFLGRCISSFDILSGDLLFGILILRGFVGFFWI